jgi:hypothetical protein
MHNFQFPTPEGKRSCLLQKQTQMQYVQKKLQFLNVTAVGINNYQSAFNGYVEFKR